MKRFRSRSQTALEMLSPAILYKENDSLACSSANDLAPARLVSGMDKRQEHGGAALANGLWATGKQEFLLFERWAATR